VKRHRFKHGKLAELLTRLAKLLAVTLCGERINICLAAFRIARGFDCVRDHHLDVSIRLLGGTIRRPTFVKVVDMLPFTKAVAYARWSYFCRVAEALLEILFRFKINQIAVLICLIERIGARSISSPPPLLTL